ncbi:hypothetical protein Axi01nite_08580 [Actinoplanes xinjiangensis]|nr:hypothetical protein Axi01nite_08580 [Actinoplanes xinjiangensis]
MEGVIGTLHISPFAHTTEEQDGEVSRSFLRARPLVPFAIVAILVGTGGAAWAIWRLEGSLTSSMAVGSAIDLEIIGNPRPNRPLYPGAKSDLRVTVRNDNTFPVLVTSLDRGGAVTADQTHRTAGCVNTGVSLTASGFSVTWRIPGRSTREFLLGQAVRMTNESDSACQGASFTIPLTASGHSDVQ